MNKGTSPEAKAALKLLINQVYAVWRPPPKLTVSEWSEAERYLSPEASAEPGKWHNARAPHLVEPMDALSPVDPCQEVVMMFPSQDGKTEVINNFVGYIIDRDPGPALVIQPNVKPMAEAWSKDRLAPMLRDTPCLKDKVADARSRDSGNTVGHKTFPGGHVSIAGANSPAGLASRPIRYLLLDEIDRYPLSAGAEGSPIKLSEKRTRRFWNRKILKVSSPTFENIGIHAEYGRSDKRQWQLKCPDCGELQFPRLKHLTWEKKPDGKLENVLYACEHCGVSHSEDEEYAIKYSGRWVTTEPGAGKPKGFWKNQISSLFITWRETIQEWLASQSDTENRQTFINTALAEPYIVKGESVDSDELYHMREHYPAQVPDGVQVLTAWFDVQKDRIEGEIMGWGLGEESWSIEYIRLYGNPLLPDIWNSLSEIIKAEYPGNDGALYPIRKVGVDCGYLTDEVYKFSRAQGRTWVLPTKGHKDRGRQIQEFPRKPDQRSRIYRVMVGTDTAKEVIYSRFESTIMAESPGGPGYCHFPIKEGYDKTYFKQATAEEKIKKYRHGVAYYEFDAKKRRNEVLDTKVGNLAMIRVLQTRFGIKLKNIEATPVVKKVPATAQKQQQRQPASRFARRTI